jgi:hypothetical protein
MKTLVLFVLIFISLDSFACDGCNVYINFSPIDYKNRISLIGRSRLMYGEYNMFGTQILTKHASHGNNPLFWNKAVQENYNTFEIRGAFYTREVWKTTIVIPFVNNHQLVGGNSRFKVNGLSDPILMESYQVFNSLKTDDDKTFKHRLQVGGGLKIPLGRIDKTYENGLPNLDLQPGSGSLDFISSITYLFKVKNFGVNSNVNFKFNGFNKNNYKYGNTLNSTINVFWQTSKGKFTFMPMIGGYFENMTLDKSKYEQNGNRMIIDYKDTGGQLLFGSAGLKLFYKSMSLSLNYQKNMYSQLNGYTQLLTKNRINVGLTYSF